ncbi:hypothetical protein [Psychroserpens sp.]|uniref:hypothetical protein n=1 Tax=Psychroserpens sp. TaxID=2020870 RepID=UPI002B26B40E|nr:hypothetical protein [Psychroserpens sp.]
MRKISILLCLAFLVFNSCEKENIAEENITQEKSNRTGILDVVWEQGQGKLGGGILIIVIESGHGRMPGAYLTSSYEEPVHFQIDSQEPCDILDVDSETGRLSLLNEGGHGLCGNYDGSRLEVQYSVTSFEGESESYFFTLDYEDFIILDLEED